MTDVEGIPRPPSLVVGVGASRGVPVEEILTLIEGALGDARRSPESPQSPEFPDFPDVPDFPESLAELATVDAKADEPGIVEAAARLGVPLITYSAEELASVEVPTPSDAPRATVGTPSVAEAAALARGGELLVPKRKSAPADGQPARATCAVVRRPGRGRGGPVGVVRNASRPDESGRLTTPGAVDPTTVEMMAVMTVDRRVLDAPPHHRTTLSYAEERF
ncbi:Cobalamin synthesis G C-terminus [Streptomyces sp. cf386]|nr:Cobalamin synthesis G C-terminus [Streptomyces sp. cf386]